MRRAVLGFTVVLVIAIVGVSAYAVAGGGAGSFTPNNRDLLPVGERAPGFAARSVEGEDFSLDDAKGKHATMLVFFATWCPRCNEEAPMIAELSKKHADLRVVMIGVDAQDNREKVHRFSLHYAIDGSTLYEPSLAKTYRVPGYPTVYVLNERREVVGANAGEAPREAYEAWIREATEGGH